MTSRDDTTSGLGGFPGGRARLPRLSQPKRTGVTPDRADDAATAPEVMTTDDSAPDRSGSEAPTFGGTVVAETPDPSDQRRARPDDPIRRNGRSPKSHIPGSGAAAKEAPSEADTHSGSEGTFADYFTTESLFSATPLHDDDDPLAGRDVADPSDDAYAVLGLSRSASWKEVSRAHRRLVAQLHPDRHVTADDDVREAAERRVRDVNEAYALIRERRAPTATHG